MFAWVHSAGSYLLAARGIAHRRSTVPVIQPCRNATRVGAASDKLGKATVAVASRAYSAFPGCTVASTKDSKQDRLAIYCRIGVHLTYHDAH